MGAISLRPSRRTQRPRQHKNKRCGRVATRSSLMAQVQGVTLNHTIFAREECQLV